VTTQVQHLSSPQSRPTAASGRPASGSVQTRLPWWAVVLPALAFAALLALLSGGTADASAAEPATDLLARLTAALPDLLHHVL
jgi:hypothetical protein